MPRKKKGEVIERIKSWIIQPLFYDKQLHKTLHAMLSPRLGGLSWPKLPQPTIDAMLKLLADDLLIGRFLVFVLLVLRTEHAMDLLAICSDHEPGDDYDETETALLERAYTLVPDQRVSLRQFKILYKFVTGRLHVIMVEHPMLAYAEQSLATTTREGRDQWARRLGVQSVSSMIGLMKIAQERYPPQPYGFLLPEDCYAHSCVPTAQLELDPESNAGDIVVTLLHDIEEEEMTICCIEDVDDVEERDTMMQRRFQQSCCCPRCRFEVHGDVERLQLIDCVRLGHLYMTKHNYERAGKLYARVVSEKRHEIDIWHALGAVELAKGNFLAAQRVWKQATQESSACQKHPGIRLQLTKMWAYKYSSFGDEQSPSGRASVPNFYSPLPGVFVAPHLGKAECDQIIRWSSTGKWTEQRHYAVPTEDIPVHTVKSLLDWFNGWFVNTVRPLLAQQFDTTPEFYVHDAFVVRYQSRSATNYLPIHTDESTHSLVVALNEEYEGGGTYFPEHHRCIRIGRGEMLSFRGDQKEHGGEAVTNGVRYILAVFLYHDSDCSDPGVKKRDREDVASVLREAKESKKAFSFGFQP